MADTLTPFSRRASVMLKLLGSEYSCEVAPAAKLRTASEMATRVFMLRQNCCINRICLEKAVGETETVITRTALCVRAFVLFNEHHEDLDRHLSRHESVEGITHFHSGRKRLGEGFGQRPQNGSWICSAI
jgi:hypothetical protein